MAVPRRELLAGCLMAATTGCASRVGELHQRLSGEWQRKRQLVETYDRGLAAYNTGVERLEVAVSYDSWAETASRIPESRAAFDTAADRFAAAETQAEALDHDDGRRICAAARERTGLIAEAASIALEAAELFADGQPDRGDERWQEFQALRDRAQQIDLASTRELARVLGLTG